MYFPLLIKRRSPTVTNCTLSPQYHPGTNQEFSWSDTFKHAQYQVKNKASHPTLLHLPRHHLPFSPRHTCSQPIHNLPDIQVYGSQHMALVGAIYGWLWLITWIGKKSLLRQSQKGTSDGKCTSTSTVRVPTLAYPSNHTSLNAWGFTVVPSHHRVHISTLGVLSLLLAISLGIEWLRYCC